MLSSSFIVVIDLIIRVGFWGLTFYCVTFLLYYIWDLYYDIYMVYCKIGKDINKCKYTQNK